MKNIFGWIKIRSTLYTACRIYRSLPLRGGRCRRRRRMRANRKGKPQHKMLFAMFAQCKEGFPSGEAVATATDEGGSICTYERHILSIIPSSQRHEAAQRDKIRPPKPTKNFPVRQPPPKKRETFSQTNMAVAVQGSSGRVREVWRVGTPLRKRGPCASKVFPALQGLPYTSINSFGLRVKL